jgi:NAD+ kinase
MSAGGAMLHPDSLAIKLTPVCPVLHSMPPLVVPETATVRVNQMQPWAKVGVTVDGQDFFSLEPDDALEVCAAKQGTLFAVVRENSYWRQLALKGFVPPYAPPRTDSA